MVKLSEFAYAKGQSILYGVKRGKIPAALRPRVLPQRKEAGKPTCLEHMSRLMSCWEGNSYEDSKCTSEIEAFLSCANDSIGNYHARNDNRKKEWTTERLSELVGHYTIVKELPPGQKPPILNK